MTGFVEGRGGPNGERGNILLISNKSETIKGDFCREKMDCLLPVLWVSCFLDYPNQSTMTPFGSPTRTLLSDSRNLPTYTLSDVTNDTTPFLGPPSGPPLGFTVTSRTVTGRSV